MSQHELVLTRLIDAPRAHVYRAWTEPALLKRWFAPRPYTTPVAELDVRAGGRIMIVMQGPDGSEIPCPGVYLEVVPNTRLVTTDAFVSEDREAHVKMGFHEGWGQCAGQLEEVARSL